MIYITGDTHRDFNCVERFCARAHTTKEDILIILGDAGINFMGKPKDDILKKALSKLPITLFCVHGNHEMRPASIPSYQIERWHGGEAYVEHDFPSLIFARDGQIYDLNGMKTVVIGGAFSVDKAIRIVRHWGWWADEQPSDAIKAEVENNLAAAEWKVDVVLSHTVPLKYVPREIFTVKLDPSKVDTSTEEWLDRIEDRLTYNRWYAGHYHTEKKDGRLRLMFNDFEIFGQ